MRMFLASDYDETFYLNDSDIKKNIECVRNFRNKNNIFVIATGRDYESIYEEIKKYNIKYDYLIINQGTTILDNKNNIIANYTIEENIKEELIQQLELYDKTSMFACKLLNNTVSINETEITKIQKKYEDLLQAKKMNQLINERYKDKIISFLIPSCNAIEIISVKTNKAKAIQTIVTIEKIDKEKIYTIGDSFNDIEMIKMFNGYSMKNGEDTIKKSAKKSYNSVSELINELLGEENEK